MQTKSIFKRASPLLINIIKNKNEKGGITFLLPTKYISEEAAQLGMFFNNYFNRCHKKKETYRTFFANSHLEALNGAIKIIREKHLLRNKHSNGIIFIFDPSNSMKMFFNPLEKEDTKALVPGLRFSSNWDEVISIFDSQDNEIIGFICGYDGQINLEKIDDIFNKCQSRHIYTGLDQGCLKEWYQSYPKFIFSNPPDIFLFGENLTNYELPFGSFSMTSSMYAPWNTISTCLTHSSCFSGNTLTLSLILAYFNQYKLIEKNGEMKISRKQKFDNYASYINPKISLIFKVTGLSPEVKYAKKSRLMINNGKTEEEILDCIAGSGCCLRGHNPDDIIPNVLMVHDYSHDYWKDLTNLLAKQTGLPHLFSATSGSSAVDFSIILCLLTHPLKTRIITFKDNYSGKSLIALNLTRFKQYRLPFLPLYFDILEMNPFETGAKETLTKELLSGNIALVWFEIMQGQGLDCIPKEILDVIQLNKEAGDYLIGIDEILTGMYRTGNFLCSEDKVTNPDIITLAKGTSDMTFPMACVLVSDKIYQKACGTNPSLVKDLETKYINQLGSHIFLNALNSAISQSLDKHVKKMGKALKEYLEPLIKKSKFLKEIKGEGLILYLKVNKKIFPFNIFEEELIEFLLSPYYLRKGKILLLNSRLMPSLTINAEEIKEISQKIIKVWDEINSVTLFFYLLKQIFIIYLMCFINKTRHLFKPK